MSAIERVLVVPRWAGTPSSDWYPWLGRSQLGRGSSGRRRPSSVGRGGLVQTLQMPDPELPTIERWTGALGRALGEDPEELERTILIGHSVGAQTVLRTLATLPQGLQVAGILLVAGWWSLDRPWDAIRPWTREPFDYGRAKTAARRRQVLLSDDDPFTKDSRAEKQLFEDLLSAEVHIHPGRQHYNQKEEPLVLAALRELLTDGR